MKVFVNEIEFILNPDAGIKDLLSVRNINPDSIAVAVNEEVVPKNEWEKTGLKEGDRILLIRATHGG